MDALLTENQVSENRQVSLAGLRRSRLRGEGPQYLKVGPLVRYRPGDIEDWVAGLPTGGNGHRFVVRSTTKTKLAASALIQFHEMGTLQMLRLCMRAEGSSRKLTRTALGPLSVKHRQRDHSVVCGVPESCRRS
jgi:hypothetical protein